MNKKNSFLLLALFLVSVSLVSCYVRPHGNIELEPTPDLALDRDWALVIEPYVQLRMEPSVSAEAIAHSRKGDIIPVIGKMILPEGNKRIVWYQFESGWLPAASVKVFSSEAKAITAATSL